LFCVFSLKIEVFTGEMPGLVFEGLRSLVKIQDTGYRIQDTGYRIQDTGYRIQDTGYRIQDKDTEYRIQDTEYRYAFGLFYLKIQNN